MTFQAPVVDELSVRVVVDSRLETPVGARILETPGTVLLYAASPDEARAATLRARRPHPLTKRLCNCVTRIMGAPSAPSAPQTPAAAQRPAAAAAPRRNRL